MSGSVYTIHMHSREIIKRIEAAVWIRIRGKGDHHTYKHLDNPLLLTLVHPKQDLSPGLIERLEKITGLNLRTK